MGGGLGGMGGMPGMGGMDVNQMLQNPMYQQMMNDVILFC
jgi:hypothetical protein